MISLPANLEAAIREILKTRPAKQWVSEAHALSQRYRGKREILPKSFARGDEQTAAYLAQILPATYAQLFGAMAATKAQARAWSPQTLLDLGSGPGTALWAAVEQWSSLTRLEAWEREPSFIEIGKKLAQVSASPTVNDSQWRRIDLRHQLPPTTPTYDFVILGHVLNELSAAAQQHIVAWAWEHCAGVLLIVEPGTSAAFPALKSAREQLLTLGARTLAPCPHDHPCPLVDDWCHFSQRLQRPRVQRRAKEAISQWEDCKFSYAAMARFAPHDAPWARVIRAPHVTKVYAEVRLCTTEKIRQLRESKKTREKFKHLKQLRWGQTLTNTPENF
jgi:ribosomal protein RSM22 (predicted rRNA methylase)